jgi:hypothetical protein
MLANKARWLVGRCAARILGWAMARCLAGSFALLLVLLIGAKAGGVDCRHFAGTIASPFPVVQITVDRLNVRYAPTTNSRIVAQITSPERPLYVESHCGSWARIVTNSFRDPDQVRGWIYLPLTCTPPWDVSPGRSPSEMLAPPCPSP